MSAIADRTDTPTALAATGSSRRWWVLVVICLAQLMVVLDATIVNIALPTAQKSLGFGNADRQWVVTAYALAFGGLLLTGGRLGDLFGRKRALLIGLVGFAAASAIGGAATDFTMLVSARACQGVFGALLAPAALSLLSTTFTAAGERARAFALYGAISGGGGAIGLILGGTLTEYLSWRWCLYVNVAIAVPVAISAVRLLERDERAVDAHLDVPGALTVSGGLFGLVYGFAHAETGGWSAPLTLVPLAAGVLLLAAFVGIEQSVERPLLPLRVLADRLRGSSMLSILISGASLFAVFLFLTYYLQETLGYSPVRTGLAFLPMIVALAGTAQVSNRLLIRVGPRPLVPLGMLLGAAGLLFFSRLQLDSSYALHILPGLIITGVGLGFAFSPSIQGATTGVDPADAGVGSAMVSTMQQIGGSIGTAIFSTVAASAATHYLTHHQVPTAAASAALHGYTTVFLFAAGLFAVGALVSSLILPSGKLEPSETTQTAVA
jgi:EmrB/QacA subfamily drug resistance transporter